MQQWTDELEVFCADIGSIARGKFAWARRLAGGADEEVHEPASINSLAVAVVYQLVHGRPVALGFEMPLFVPVPAASEQLGKARPCDKNAPAWSSGVGASVMATGLPQVAWILRRIHEHVPDVGLYVQWEPFALAQQGVLLWEAFVTRDAKGKTDEEDAVIGVKAFCAQFPEPGDDDAKLTEQPLSLAAAAAAWAGWPIALDALRSSCVLIRA